MDLVKLLPDRPAMDNGELSAWLMEHGGRGREVLTYRKDKIRNPLTEQLEPVARCTCSVCGSEWLTNVYGYNGTYPEFENHDGIQINGRNTTCPECGAAVEAVYYTRLKKYPIKSTAYPWEIINRDGNIMFICWAIIYEIDEYGPALWPEKRNAYVLDTAGRWHRFTGMQRMGWCSCSPMEYTGQWYEVEKFAVADGGFRRVLPHDPAVYEGTALENAKLEKLEAANTGADLLLYARLYLRHPTAENITMNSPRLMAAALRYTKGVTDLDWINWAARKPHEMLYMEKPDYKQATTLSLDAACAVMDQQKAVGACMIWGAPKEYANTLGEHGIAFAFSAYKNKDLRGWSLVRMWNYVQKVAATLGNKHRDIKDAATLCVDYWKDAKRAKFDLANSVVMFPKDLKEAHARAISAIKYTENEKYKTRFERKAKQLAPLQWESGDLLIIPAQSESQLIQEGKTLGHCVGGYGDAHCKGDCIFFIRHTAAPDLPFFTLQLNTKTGKVLQNRGKKNCERTQEVRDFEEQWLAVIVAPWIQKKTKAARKAMA